jgi:hypothetical protein
VPTLAAQTRPPRSQRKGRSRGPCIYLAYGRSTCAQLASRVDTKVSHDDTVSGKESRWCGCGRPSGPLRRACWYGRSGSVSAFLAAALARAADRDQRARVDRLATATNQQPKQRCFGSTHTNLRDGKSLRCPPSRRVPHKWSGRRPIRTWSAQRTFRYETRRTCLSSEGWHRRLCAPRSAPRRRAPAPPRRPPARPPPAPASA